MRSLFIDIYALPSPPPGRSPSRPSCPEKRSAPGFAIGGGGGDLGSIRELSGHRIAHASRRGWAGAMG
eukprot:3159868-Prymnesium_polylepis.1